MKPEAAWRKFFLKSVARTSSAPLRYRSAGGDRGNFNPGQSGGVRGAAPACRW